MAHNPDPITPLHLVREQAAPGRADDGELVGESAALRELRRVLRRVAPMPSTVLLEGETGTGKELAARALHRWSGRTGRFVPVNCGAFTPELLEAALFGHVKGAFTGAQQAREGLCLHASGGTLFLDEIGEMPLSLQAHLLRMLEQRRVRPVGADREVAVDLRVVAATHRNLAEEVAAGRFREDLYYRLNVLRLRLPPLRERREDIPVLVRHFVQCLARDLGREAPPLRAADLQPLMDHPWPGNVRELRNVVERCLLLGTRPARCLDALAPPAGHPDPAGADLRLASVERRHILHVLALEGGNKSAAARRLGIARKTLERKLKEWRAAGLA